MILPNQTFAVQRTQRTMFNVTAFFRLSFEELLMQSLREHGARIKSVTVEERSYGVSFVRIACHDYRSELIVRALHYLEFRNYDDDRLRLVIRKHIN